MELVNGRPANCAGRLEKEIRCYDLLDSLGIDYRRIDHEAAMTMEACEEIDRVLDAVICKNLLLCNRQCTDFYLLMLPGDKHFKTSVLSKEIGSSRLSFAAPEYMEKFLNITPGSVSVLGLMNDGGEPCAASHGRGRAERGVHRLPSLHQHLQPALSDG